MTDPVLPAALPPLSPAALPPVSPVSRDLAPALRAALDGKAKPVGSLGRIEELALRLGLIQGTLRPRLDRAALLIFAGDHGLNQEGVSAYPSGVTAAMVSAFLSGRASANAFAGVVGADVTVVDAGVARDLPAHPALIRAKIRHGTRNAACEPAMTPDEVGLALSRGAALGREAARCCDVLALGEMGIGNSAAAALLMHRLLPAPLPDCIGQGAGHDPAGLERKRAALERAAARAAPTDPADILAEFGGCEIVMMAGAAIGAASERRAVLVDGFIGSVAALAAIRLVPAVQDHCIFAHRSAERGHALLLERRGAEPLLDLGLRLGEGTGALLAVPLLRAAARLLGEVADLSDLLGDAG